MNSGLLRRSCRVVSHAARLSPFGVLKSAAYNDRYLFTFLADQAAAQALTVFKTSPLLSVTGAAAGSAPFSAEAGLLATGATGSVLAGSGLFLAAMTGVSTLCTGADLLRAPPANRSWIIASLVFVAVLLRSSCRARS